jgi:hypothetical protein
MCRIRIILSASLHAIQDSSRHRAQRFRTRFCEHALRLNMTRCVPADHCKMFWLCRIEVGRFLVAELTESSFSPV